MLDQAFEALKSYNWGPSRSALRPIDEALVTTQDDPAAKKELEGRLAKVLGDDVPRGAKDFVCRKLRVIGTAASVPALAALLPDAELSHMSRYALETIPAPEAAEALRAALPKLGGDQKAGVIGSLGVRQDAASVPALAALLGDPDETVAQAAAYALGDIRNAEAAKALAAGKPNGDQAKLAATDASLSCAEGLLEKGDKAGALGIYRKLATGDQPKHVRLAATRGILACASKKR